ncbi:MAG: hypothetical protein K0R50_4438, partial [Eubacterium sp.]|nr:hypothetical protein [Eubacterium sp.]
SKFKKDGDKFGSKFSRDDKKGTGFSNDRKNSKDWKDNKDRKDNKDEKPGKIKFVGKPPKNLKPWERKPKPGPKSGK